MRMRKVIGYLMALAMVVALGACGDDVVEGDDTQNDAVENAENGGEDNQGENNQSAPIGPEDCGEDELYNPNLGECVEVGNGDDNQEDPDANDPDENNQDPSQECEDDEVWDDEEGQCVPRVPAECGPGHLIGTACRPDGGNLGGAQVLLEGVDLDGNRVQYEADELEARLFQHELDHLNGVLMFDRMEAGQRREAVAAYRRMSESPERAPRRLRLS